MKILQITTKPIFFKQHFRQKLLKLHWKENMNIKIEIFISKSKDTLLSSYYNSLEITKLQLWTRAFSARSWIVFYRWQSWAHSWTALASYLWGSQLGYFALACTDGYFEENERSTSITHCCLLPRKRKPKQHFIVSIVIQLPEIFFLKWLEMETDFENGQAQKCESMRMRMLSFSLYLHWL